MNKLIRIESAHGCYVIHEQKGTVYSTSKAYWELLEYGCDVRFLALPMILNFRLDRLWLFSKYNQTSAHYGKAIQNFPFLLAYG